MSNLAEHPLLPVIDASDTPLELVAAVLKAAGDPLRLEILRILQRDTFGVLELCQLLDVKQSGMSHHLKVLSRAQLLEPQREGNSIFYRRPLCAAADGLDEQARRQVFALADQLSLSDERLAKITAIRLQRGEQSRLFFERNADQFIEQQELIAPHALYAAPAAAIIRAQQPGIRMQALEIGPGEGAFLLSLSPWFERVVGLDNSPQMLQVAASRCQQAAAANVELVVGETAVLLDRGEAFDLIVANMVCHHLPNPADLFLDAAALLNNGGRMVVSDLCSHEQDWVRETCGDIWLGFTPEQLTSWAQEAGLQTTETLFIGLRNGFQIQVREFVKGPA